MEKKNLIGLITGILLIVGAVFVSATFLQGEVAEEESGDEASCGCGSCNGDCGGSCGVEGCSCAKEACGSGACENDCGGSCGVSACGCGS